ncbi:hypothetical protein [Rhizobium sp. NFR12]|uniref:hypothetical protein n=1 Tax=Rhizobium sp. NFR12 TaxID=1566261 RepID=UPI0008A766FE|nr:hypothetical protein [Rhizobium sp. NFR12]SEH22539.1 hypothetical protein SAMN03159407_1180 [Rhizobium sp. NFR12]
MTALSAPRNTPRRERTTRHVPIGAGVKLIAGGMAGINPAGYLVPVTAVATLKGIARIEQTVDNLTGSNGAVLAKTEVGTFRYENSASADLITRADIGSDAYGVDDQTVAKTSATNSRSIVGKIFDVDDQGVWVTFA